MHNRRRKRNHDKSPEGSVSVGDNRREASHQSSSRQSKERSQDFANRVSVSLERRRHHSAAMDAISRALRKAAWSPFSDEIEHARMSRRFSRPSFISYDGKVDPAEHVSHYIQIMSLYNQNDALMCKVFPSKHGSTALRWSRKGSIHNFGELIQKFGARFMTCSRVPQPVDVLLSMKMGIGKIFWSYANRYWELYNEIGGGNEKVATSTFRLGLPEDSKLRESLTIRPPENMRWLIRHVEEYKRLEDDRQQSKGKAPTTLRARRELRIQEPNARTREINVAFKEPVHKILERIKNKPYFRWPSKMGGGPLAENWARTKNKKESK